MVVLIDIGDLAAMAVEVDIGDLAAMALEVDIRDIEAVPVKINVGDLAAMTMEIDLGYLAAMAMEVAIGDLAIWEWRQQWGLSSWGLVPNYQVSIVVSTPQPLSLQWPLPSPWLPSPQSRFPLPRLLGPQC